MPTTLMILTCHHIVQRFRPCAAQEPMEGDVLRAETLGSRGNIVGDFGHCAWRVDLYRSSLGRNVEDAARHVIACEDILVDGNR